MRKKYITIIGVVIVAISIYMIHLYISKVVNDNKVIDKIENATENSTSNIEILSSKEILGKLDDGCPWLPLAVSDDGIIYGVVGRSSKNESSLISYNIKSEEINTIDRVQDDLRPVFLKENDNYIAWIEGIFQYERQETRIKLYNKVDETVKVIFEDKSYLSFDSSPLSLGDDFVLWIDYKYEDDIMYPLIKKYTISTGETTIYKENATSPVICDNFIAFITADESNEMLSAVYIEDLKNNKIEQITNGKRIQHIDGKGDSVVISYRDDAQQYCLDIYENGKLNIIESNNEYAYEYPKISEGFITWKSLNTNEIYDRRKKETIIIDKNNSVSMTNLSDHYIVATSAAIPTEEQKNYAKDYGMVLSNIYILNY